MCSGNFYTIFLLIILLTAFNLKLSAQKKTRIRIIQAETMVGDKTSGEELNIFTGDVIFEHDSAFLYCDSAVLNSEKNNVEAYFDVRIEVSDTLNLYGNYLNYNGNTRLATMTGNVKLVDNDATLYTNRLLFDRSTEIAYYTTGGRIISEENELTSERGYYYTFEKTAYFKEDVRLTNPDYLLLSDTLIYNTYSKIVQISGPTTIEGDEEFLYAEDGWYNTTNDKLKLRENPYLRYREQFLYGDSLRYEKAIGIGKALGNVLIRDTVQNVLVRGHYADYRRSGGYAFVTDSAVAVLIDKTDSLFMHADTLRLTFDSTENPQKVLGYYKCKFFKTDIQGMCDSLNYDLNDSTITMYQKPALWTQGNQITAERIKIFTSSQKVDSMHMTRNAFIISRDKYENDKYNQIKGKDMTGFFRNNELHLITVRGNSETIYFVREEEGALIGINKALSSNMEIWVEERQISDIYYFDSPDATLYPEDEFPVQQLKLRDFNWLGEDRPKNKFDIFRWKRSGQALDMDEVLN